MFFKEKKRVKLWPTPRRDQMNHSFISKMKVNWTKTFWVKMVTWHFRRSVRLIKSELTSHPTRKMSKESISFRNNYFLLSTRWTAKKMTWWFLDSRSSSSQLSIKSDRPTEKNLSNRNEILSFGIWNSMNWVVRLLISGPLTCWAKIESPMKFNISLCNQLSS